MKFKIEQIAIVPNDPERAMRLFAKIGLTDWAKDHVVATGKVWGVGGSNGADLAFNYQATGDKALELEVLHYTSSPNWMERYGTSASHLGMHVTEEELVGWRWFFAEEKIAIAQEVATLSHTNPVIAGKRWYKYVIFDTRAILGIDLKFIVRREAA
jgi:hypothetical protein|tara:strand:+ start:1183 stop:1650 length:468 start_codon:yes stop_codon:yes gene_type:complete